MKGSHIYNLWLESCHDSGSCASGAKGHHMNIMDICGGCLRLLKQGLLMYFCVLPDYGNQVVCVYYVGNIFSTGLLVFA